MSHIKTLISTERRAWRRMLGSHPKKEKVLVISSSKDGLTHFGIKIHNLRNFLTIRTSSMPGRLIEDGGWITF